MTRGRDTTPATFRKFDAGDVDRAKGVTGDCQVRALCTARGLRYPEAWSILYTLQGERRACSFTLVEDLDMGHPRLGVVRALSFPAERGKRRMTGEEFCRKYRKGRFILRMAHHVVAVKDGQLYDTFDCSHACVYKAWEIEPETSHE